MTCPSCGAPVAGTSPFCSSCGASLRGPAEGPEGRGADAGAGAPPTGGASLPRWLVTDWPLAILHVFCFLAIAAGAGAVIGFVPTAIANGFGPESLVGLVAGAWLGFAGLGADTAVVVSADEGLALWSTHGLVLAVTGGLLFLARGLFRATLPRVSGARDFTLAFIGKVAVVGAAAVAVAGSLASIGDLDAEDGPDGFAVLSDVGVGEAAWVALVLLAVAGLWAARDRLTRPDWLDRVSWLAPLRYGVAAWVAMVLLLGATASAVALGKGDDATETIAGAVAAPVVVPNAGVATGAFAVGASNDTTSDSDNVDPMDPFLDEHVSLFHWGVPPDEDSDAAPLWLWPLLAVVPVLSFFAARAHLRRADARTAGTILAGALTVAAGFALTAWLGALFAPMSAAAAAITSDGGLGFDFTGRGVSLHPSVAATFGLTLAWAVAGALASAFVWAASHRIDLIGSFSSASSGAAARTCPGCGSQVADVPFCPECGTALRPSPPQPPTQPPAEAP